MVNFHLGHPGSKDSSDQLADQVGSHHDQLLASTQIDGSGEGRVEMGATGKKLGVNFTSCKLTSYQCLYQIVCIIIALHIAHKAAFNL